MLSNMDNAEREYLYPALYEKSSYLEDESEVEHISNRLEEVKRIYEKIEDNLDSLYEEILELQEKLVELRGEL